MSSKKEDMPGLKENSSKPSNKNSQNKLKPPFHPNLHFKITDKKPNSSKTNRRAMSPINILKEEEKITMEDIKYDRKGTERISRDRF